MSGPCGPPADLQIANLLFAVLLLDNELTIRQANHAAEDLLGRSQARLIGMHVARACGIAPEIAERIARDNSPLVARCVSITPNGRYKSVDLTISPMAAWDGWRMVTFLEAGQNSMPSERQSSPGIQGPSILAHEIKNPLAAIRGAGQLLARKPNGRNDELTTIIATEVARISDLLDRMQVLGRETVEPVRGLNPHHHIRQAVASVETAQSLRGLIAEQFDPSIPPVRASPGGLQQVLINLLSNAVDACADANMPAICIRTRFVSGLTVRPGTGEASRALPVEIAVCDNGPGIAETVAQTLFDPFVTHKPNGQGLGLALVVKLMRDMGGRIDHVRANGMTEFRLHLALADEEA